MHIGILGGTFNPIHIGHLIIAEHARESFSLEKVLFVPSAIPPHKDAVSLIDCKDRIEMVRVATDGNPYFEVSDIEIKRGGASYSIETLRELRSIMGDDLEMSFILGWDAFEEITTWKDYRQLFELSNFIVADRVGYAKKPITDILPVETSKSFCYDKDRSVYIHSSYHFVAYLDTPLVDISSTHIREMRRQGRSVRYLVPDGVFEYIMEHGLYR